MNPIRKWAIACYEFLFAEPGIKWHQVMEQVEADCEQHQRAKHQAVKHQAARTAIEVEYWDDEPLQIPYSDFPTAGYFLLDAGEMEDEENDLEDEDLEDEDYSLVHYRIQALGGDTFMEYSYEGELDEAAIVQALTHLWQTTPHSTNQLAGTLQLPIAPAYF